MKDKEYKLPIIELTEPERLWLQEVYNILRENKRPNQRQIFSKLHGKIPNNFLPASLDNRLIESSGENITILGIIALEKNYGIVEKANKIIFKIRDFILADPERTKISIPDIARQCEINDVEAGLILSLVGYYGRFYQGASASLNGVAYNSIDIGTDTRYFQQYYYFTGLESVIISHLKQDDKPTKPTVSESEAANPLKYSMDIFISHSNQDADIAKAVIDLIRYALNIPAKKIRCTSVNGYKLPVGAETDDELRTEIFGSKVFIGIISPISIQSTYVLFELGARWGAKLPLLPLITNKLGIELLKGPLKNINSLNCCVEEDVFQFINDLAQKLDVTPEAPSVYNSKVAQLVKICLEETLPSESNFITQELNKRSTSLISEDISEKIIKEQAKKEWPDDYSMQVYYIEKQREAVKGLKNITPPDLTEAEFTSIRKKAQIEWPLDFEMQLHSEQEQIESLRKLRGM